MNFAVLWLFVEVFSAKFGDNASVARQKEAIHDSFLHENHFLPIRESFLPRKFPALQ